MYVDPFRWLIPTTVYYSTAGSTQILGQLRTFPSIGSPASEACGSEAAAPFAESTFLDSWRDLFVLLECQSMIYFPVSLLDPPTDLPLEAHIGPEGTVDLAMVSEDIILNAHDE
jgi:hypothetical protein